MEARDRKESEKQGKKFPGYENKRKKFYQLNINTVNNLESEGVYN